LLFLVSTNAFGRQGLHGLRDEAICGTIMWTSDFTCSPHTQYFAPTGVERNPQVSCSLWLSKKWQFILSTTFFLRVTDWIHRD
jgi:hypothetical protein